MARRKRQVQIVVDVKSQKALRAIRKLGQENQITFRRMDRTLRRLNSGWRQFQLGIVATNQTLGLLGRAFAGITTIARGFFTLIDESATQQSGINQLRLSLRALGSVDVPQAMESIEAFAAQQQRLTRFGDDQTRAIVTNLATVLHGTETTTEQLTQLAGLVQDVVERTGRSADETSRAIGRVYAGQVDALNEILPAEREYLALLGEVRGSAAASARAIELLNHEFEGSAAAIDDAEQSTANIINTWGDFREALGEALTEASIEAGTFDELQESLNELITLTSESGPQFVEFLTHVATGINAIVASLSDPHLRRGMTSFLIPVIEGARLSGQVSGLTAYLDGLERLREYRRGGGEAPTEARTEDSEDVFTLEEALEEQAEIRSRYDRLLRERNQATRREEMAELRAARDRQQEAEERRREAAAAAASAHMETERMSALLKQKIEDDLAALRLARYEASVIWAEAVADSKTEAADALEGFIELRDRMLEIWGDMGRDLPGAVAEATETATEAMTSGIVDGLQTAEAAFRGFASTIPRIMGDSAQDGADRIAAVFQLLGQAAQIASAAGLATKAASAWLGPLSSFLSMASAAAAFVSAMGKSSGTGGGRASTGARGAVATEAADVLVGQRPEAERGGQARIINFQIGTVLNNDASRKDIASMVRMSQELGELRGV